MEKVLIEITTQIYIALLKHWPETDVDKRVKEAEQAARLILKLTYQDDLKAMLHNLQLDYDSLRKKYDDLILERHKAQEDLKEK
jgi:hypothetical protein